MDKDLGELQRRYRRIAAPPQFASELRSALQEQTAPGSAADRQPLLLWIGAGAVAASLFAIALLPDDMNGLNEAGGVDTLRPSLTAMARMKPVRPESIRGVSFSGLSSVRLPSPPKLSSPPVLSKRGGSKSPDSAARSQENHSHAIT